MFLIPLLTPLEEPPPIGNPNYRQFPDKPRITHFSQDCNTTFVLSWDDARSSDVNLAPIDQKYGISHTIFTTSYRSYPNNSYWRYSFLIDELFQGYDIQSHCGKHIHLSKYNTEDQEFYVKWGRTGIEDLFGFTPVVFAYPYGDRGGSTFVQQYFDLGRTINGGGASWPPSVWSLEGTTISVNGISDTNLNQIESILQKIYHSDGYQVFKGYGHTNLPGKNYGVIDFAKYEQVISKIANWPDVWYTSWGELVAYEIEKQFVEFSSITYYDNKLEFEFSTPSLDTNIYKIPLTVGILIPKSWKNPFPQIENKFTSQYSVREYNDSKELLLQVYPNDSEQKITIFRNKPISDHKPPVISNITLETRFISQDWDQVTPQFLHHTFLRFSVMDSLSNVLSVNASVFLKNGENLEYPVMKNPIFWGNSSYGRVLWDSNILNLDRPQITENDIDHIIINARDGFGNLLQTEIFSDGTQKSIQIISSDGKLLRLNDRPQSSSNRLSE
jgi:peptidoglycan/xylan/chitin deacetylase (PgdA/CDA1 family)